MTGYIKRKTAALPRLPLEGTLDLTYRCNNDCRHCWVKDSVPGREELSFEEIRRIVDEARGLGCRKWSISGGEPMLRPDFPEIFDYVTGKCVSYTLNTNGTLITPEIARMMRRKGTKLVAIYGATPAVHDHITRNPGSFEMAMEGISRLREAGAGFTVQIVPMRDNYHEVEQMVALAESLSPRHRFGASWLFFSANRDSERNRRIEEQRLTPAQVVEIDGLDPFGEKEKEEVENAPEETGCGGYLLSACIGSRQSFHVDPVGKMSFCVYIKEDRMRFDLKKGSVRDAWERFIPDLASIIQMDSDYQTGCGSCGIREDCRWCAAYAYLEHGRYGGKIEYLCGIAEAQKKRRHSAIETNRRYFEIAGVTIRVDSDLPISEDTFDDKFKTFEVDGPSEDMVIFRHHFSLPEIRDEKLRQPLYDYKPWKIFKDGENFLYIAIDPSGGRENIHRVVTANADHSRVSIFHKDESLFLGGNLHSISILPTDQVLLVPLFGYRDGLILHASGVALNGKGFVFVGHSGAGKSTIAKMLKVEGRVLCDDRIIVRRWTDGFRIHGTWSHGDLPDVSSEDVPLRGVFFLEQAAENRIVSVEDPRERFDKLQSCLVKALNTRIWWEQVLSIMEAMIGSIPFYRLRFDKTGAVRDVLHSKGVF